MSDPQRDRPHDPEPVRTERDTDVDSGASAMDDRGGSHDTAPNPHDEAGAEQTAARAAGTITGMFFPVVIVAVVAIVVILYFVFR